MGHCAPFAGMTRIRFCGRQLPSRPLSPVCTGLPRVDSSLVRGTPPRYDAPMTASPERIVVVGGGLAGLRTVEELRGLGYPGTITLIGAEVRPPYDRPPLSKQLMAGEVDDTTLRAELGSLGTEF